MVMKVMVDNVNELHVTVNELHVMVDNVSEIHVTVNELHVMVDNVSELHVTVNELHVMVDNVNELHITIVHYFIMITWLITVKPKIWVEINQSNPENLKLNMVILSMDWFKGKFTGKPRIEWENLLFPVDFPLNQSIDINV